MKYFVLTLVLCLAALCGIGESYEGCCSTEHAHEVQSMWVNFWRDAANSYNRYTIMKSVFQCLVKKSPGVQEELNRIGIESYDSPKFHAFSTRVMGILDTSIHLLQEDAVLEIFLRDQVHRVEKSGGDTKPFEVLPQCYHEVFSHTLPCYNPRAYQACNGKINDIVVKYRKEHEEVAAHGEHDEPVQLPAEGEAVQLPAEGEAVQLPAEGEAVQLPAEGEAVQLPAKEGEGLDSEGLKQGDATSEDVGGGL